MDAPPRSFPGPGVRSMPTVRHGCSAVVYVSVRNSGCRSTARGKSKQDLLRRATAIQGQEYGVPVAYRRTS